MALGKQVLEIQAQIGTQTAQEWARIPRVGQQIEGCYRSLIFHLVRTNQIKTAAIKQPGAARAGMRLIHIPSLRAWIAKHADNNGLEVA